MTVINTFRPKNAIKGNQYNLARAIMAGSVVADKRSRFVLAGGALRDGLLGKQPKDFDFVHVSERRNMDESINLLVASMPDVFKGAKIETFEDYVDAENADETKFAVNSVVKVELVGGMQIDFIDPKRQAYSPMDVLSQFDFSINALVWDYYLDRTYSLDTGHVWIIDEAHLNFERYKRFKAMFPQRNWDVVERHPMIVRFKHEENMKNMRKHKVKFQNPWGKEALAMKEKRIEHMNNIFQAMGAGRPNLEGRRQEARGAGFIQDGEAFARAQQLIDEAILARQVPWPANVNPHNHNEIW